MARMRDIRKIGALALLGAGVAILPAGCGTVPSEGSEEVSSAQSAAYERALNSKSPTDVTNFIEVYRGSAQSAQLLNAMPVSTLSNVPRQSVLELSSNVQRQLNSRVQALFGVNASRDGDAGENTDSVGRSGS